MTVSCRDEMMMWVFTHLFHLQIYVWGRSLNVALMVSQWWLWSVPASSWSSGLSPKMSDASRVTSHQESYDREDSCGLLSLRLAIWTQTKPAHVLLCVKQLAIITRWDQQTPKVCFLFLLLTLRTIACWMSHQTCTRGKCTASVTLQFR